MNDAITGPSRIALPHTPGERCPHYTSFMLVVQLRKKEEYQHWRVHCPLGNARCVSSRRADSASAGTFAALNVRHVA